MAGIAHQDDEGLLLARLASGCMIERDSAVEQQPLAMRESNKTRRLLMPGRGVVFLGVMVGRSSRGK